MAKVIIQMDNDESFIQWGPNWFLPRDKDGKLPPNPNAQSEFDERVKHLKEFQNKYSNIHPNFTDSLKVDDEEGCFMIDLTAKEILLPEQSESFEAKLLSNDVGNKRGVGFGVSCFDDGFYSELFNLFNDDGDVDGEFRVTISGNFEGYYEFSAILKNDGFHWEMEKEDY